MYDGTALLISISVTGYDDLGNPIETVTAREVFVQPRGVYASEFYNAANLGIKPSLTLYMTNRADYEGETRVEFEGKEYTVVRVDWNAQRDGISLICEEKVNNDVL